LLSHLQFTPGGLVKALRTSATRGPACGLQLVMPLGGTLHETIAYNLIPQATSEFEQDVPPWETTETALGELKAGAAVTPAGPVQRYAWLSRAVLLRLAHGELRHALYAEGIALGESPKADPMSAVVVGTKGPHPLFINEDRAFWRDFLALTGDADTVPPAVIETALEIRGLDSAPLELMIGGLVPDQAKIVLWRLEERCVSPAMLRNPGVIALVASALKLAEQAGDGMRAALWTLVVRWLEQGRDRDANRAEATALLKQLGGMPRFWQELESAFWRLVDRLGAGEPADVALSTWACDLRETMTLCWLVTERQLGASSRSLVAQAKAASAFRSALARTRS
ncbi:MAG: type I-E CRISPR-associated protein Cse1/CasA, partial [Burkholderiaceae bacterium]